MQKHAEHAKWAYKTESDLPTYSDEVCFHDNRCVWLSSEVEASALLREVG